MVLYIFACFILGGIVGACVGWGVWFLAIKPWLAGLEERVRD